MLHTYVLGFLQLVVGKISFLIEGGGYLICSKIGGFSALDSPCKKDARPHRTLYLKFFKKAQGWPIFQGVIFSLYFA